jgi:hypothetical protein
LNSRIWSLLLIISILISIIGVFLPWASLEPNRFWAWTEIHTGTWIWLGIFALMSLVATALLEILFVVTRNKAFLFPVFVGGAIVVVLASLWILKPGTFDNPDPSYRVLYGSYITLFGATLVSALALVSYYVASANNRLPKTK